MGIKGVTFVLDKFCWGDAGARARDLLAAKIDLQSPTGESGKVDWRRELSEPELYSEVEKAPEKKATKISHS